MVNINEIFDNRKSGSRTTANPRTYDVRITLNKSGSKGFVVRFGFLNESIKAFIGKSYIQVSKVEKLPDRIYFRLFDNREYIDTHKLVTNSKAATSYLYMTITPTSNEEKIYRAKWINKEFRLHRDENNELFYIELEKES